MPKWKRFGNPETVQISIRWVDDSEPPERRPAAYGWSMGQLTVHVAGVNVTVTRLGEEQQPYVGWYLAPFLDWLATNWVALLHEERFPWPNPGTAPAAIACNRALDEWMVADDPHGQEQYADAQDWYFRHGVRSAAAGGIFPDLFIRRVADDIELSWSGAPMEFTRDGLAFESGAGHARLPVPEVAETILQMLEWAVSHPPESPAQYRDEIAALKTKVEALRRIAYFDLVRTYVPAGLLERATVVFEGIGQMNPFESNRADTAMVPYIGELPPAVAMFGGVPPDLGKHDVEYLCEQIIAGQGGNDSRELAELVADRHGSPLDVTYRDGHRFARELLEDMALLDSDFIDVQGMCSRLEVDLQETELETNSIRGLAIAGDGFSPRIVINRTHYFNGDESGKRFTIAHELCHVLFDRTRARRVAHASSGRWAARGIEKRANAFAAHLLMPRALLLAHLRDADRVEKYDVQHIASQLRVNESALLDHLRNLDLIDDVDGDQLLDRDTIVVALICEQHKTWVAARRESKLDTLMPKESYDDAIQWSKNYVTYYMPTTANNLSALVPSDLRGQRPFNSIRITLWPSHRGASPRIDPIDSAALIDSSTPRNFTEGILRMRPYREKMRATHRRIVLHEPFACEAAAQVLSFGNNNQIAP